MAACSVVLDPPFIADVLYRGALLFVLPTSQPILWTDLVGMRRRFGVKLVKYCSRSDVSNNGGGKTPRAADESRKAGQSRLSFWTGAPAAFPKSGPDPCDKR